MRRCFLLILALILTASCSRPDFDTSVQVQAWLESLDPDAKVIQVWCKGNIEESPGSGIWKEFDFSDEFSALEVLARSANRGLDWSDIVALMISTAKDKLPDLVAIQRELTNEDTKRFKMSFRVEDLRCDGKALRSPPPIQLRKCPNDINGCEEPPTLPDPPPLPPPDPGGGGDF